MGPLFDLFYFTRNFHDRQPLWAEIYKIVIYFSTGLCYIYCLVKKKVKECIPMAKKQFKAESKRLLDLMINSIYTHK